MLYAIGEHIDLTYLNKPRQVKTIQKKSGHWTNAQFQTASTQVEVGAAFTWTKDGKLARKITVQFA